MSKDRESNPSSSKRKRKNRFGWFLSREEPDENYLPDLKSQWQNMQLGDRIKFVLGAFVGTLIFFGALILVYLLLAAMVGIN